VVPPTQEYRFTLSKYPQRFTEGCLSGAVFGSGRLGGYSGTLIFPTLIGVIGIVKAFGFDGTGHALSSCSVWNL